MREGYRKVSMAGTPLPGSEANSAQYDAYQMPTLRGFVTFINNPADLQEFFQAPENILSLLGPLSEVSIPAVPLIFPARKLIVPRSSRQNILFLAPSTATPKHY